MWVVSIIYMTGIKTVIPYTDETIAYSVAKELAQTLKGCRVFFGSEVIAQSSTTEED